MATDTNTQPDRFTFNELWELKVACVHEVRTAQKNLGRVHLADLHGEGADAAAVEATRTGCGARYQLRYLPESEVQF